QVVCCDERCGVVYSKAKGRVPERSSQHREALRILGGSCAELMLIVFLSSPARIMILAFPLYHTPPGYFQLEGINWRALRRCSILLIPGISKTSISSDPHRLCCWRGWKSPLIARRSRRCVSFPTGQ